MVQQQDFDSQWTGRTFSVSNISLVITYVTIAVAAVMLAGFLWLSFAFSSTDQYESQGYGYSSRYGYSRNKREETDEDGKFIKTS